MNTFKLRISRKDSFNAKNFNHLSFNELPKLVFYVDLEYEDLIKEKVLNWNKNFWNSRCEKGIPKQDQYESMLSNAITTAITNTNEEWCKIYEADFKNKSHILLNAKG